MEAHLVDPRDVRWEVSSPNYRVYFWEPLPAPSTMMKSTEYELTGAHDVHEVLHWADEQVLPHQSFEVFAVVNHPDRGLVRIAGADPTRAGLMGRRGRSEP